MGVGLHDGHGKAVVVTFPTLEESGFSRSDTLSMRIRSSGWGVFEVVGESVTAWWQFDLSVSGP